MSSSKRLSFETATYEKQNNIAIISFGRPEKLNAQNDRLSRDFLSALKEAATDDGVYVIVIKGDGRAFCSGHDLKEDMAGVGVEGEMSAVERLQDTSRILLGMDKPVIAAIHGYALGVGCEWAMNCDIRIAAEGTKFGFPETSLGSTLTNAGTKLLPLIIGLGRAKELVFTNRIIDAKQAKEWGLVNEVVPLDSLEETTLHMAEKIARNPRFGIRLAKTALNLGCCGDLSEVLEREAKDAVLSAQHTSPFISKIV